MWDMTGSMGIQFHLSLCSGRSGSQEIVLVNGMDTGSENFSTPLIRLLFEFSLFYFAPGGNYMLLLFLGTVCAMSVRPGTTY